MNGLQNSLGFITMQLHFFCFVASHYLGQGRNHQFQSVGAQFFSTPPAEISVKKKVYKQIKHFIIMQWVFEHSLNFEVSASTWNCHVFVKIFKGSFDTFQKSVGAQAPMAPTLITPLDWDTKNALAQAKMDLKAWILHEIDL